MSSDRDKPSASRAVRPCRALFPRFVTLARKAAKSCAVIGRTCPPSVVVSMRAGDNLPATSPGCKMILAWRRLSSSFCRRWLSCDVALPIRGAFKVDLHDHALRHQVVHAARAAGQASGLPVDGDGKTFMGHGADYDAFNGAGRLSPDHAASGLSKVGLFATTIS